MEVSNSVHDIERQKAIDRSFRNLHFPSWGVSERFEEKKTIVCV